jgi:hypothetical protein
VRQRSLQLRQELTARATPSVPKQSLLIGLLLLSALALGGSLGTLLSPAAAPASLAVAPRLETVEATELAFRDPQEASFVLTTAPPQSLRTGAGGVLTSFSCHEGGGLGSGTALFSVNGAAVVGLATSMPLWRDLDMGDEGPDVAALQAELARLGKGVAIDGFWGRADAAAFAELITAAGASPVPSAVSLGSIAWLPAPSVTISACLLAPGSSIAAGQAIAEFPLSLTSAQLKQRPAGTVPGDRVIVTGGREYPVPDDGLITDPDPLAALLDSPEYRLALTESDTSAVAYDYLLASPVEVSSIPPSAIYDLEATEGCVQQGGVATRVEILASQLGQSLVVPVHPLATVDLHPDTDVGCR